jgi:hypothetical protein
MTLKLANSLDWILNPSRKMTSNTSKKEFLLLKVDEDGLDSSLEDLTDYGDRPSICVMLVIAFSVQSASP